jgi:hypothetical protein
VSRIFISHSREDSAHAAVLRARLAGEGHTSIFLDFDPGDGIPAGRDWELAIYTELRQCAAVIALCSRHSLASQWCFAEVAQARALGKTIIALRLDHSPTLDLLRDTQIVDAQSDTEEAYRRMFRGLRSAGLDPANAFDWDGTRPPYPGLVAFAEEDASVFFGREADIGDAVAALMRLHRFGGARLLVLLGASGSGKSSLMRAGMVPRLRRDSRSWLVLPTLRRGTAGDLTTVFRDVDRHRAAVRSSQPDATMLLPIDQFEDFLTGDEDGNRFLPALASVLRERARPLIAAVTLRSDFFGRFQSHPALAGTPFETLAVRSMSMDNLLEVIEGPARVAGVDLGDGLAEAMVRDTGTADALPLLAFALRELWESRRAGNTLSLRAYRDELRGLEGSVQRAAEAVLHTHVAETRRGRIITTRENRSEVLLLAEDESQLRTAFMAMVRLDDDGQYVRQRASWSAFPAETRTLLHRFVQARLLVIDADTVEVAHEALFRAWPRLLDWLNADRNYLVWRRRLRFALEEWEQRSRHESALLAGPLLTESIGWSAKNRGDGRALSAAERDFIRVSNAHAARQTLLKSQRRARLLVLSWTAALIVAISGVTAWWQARTRAAEAVEDALVGKLLAGGPGQALDALYRLTIANDRSLAWISDRANVIETRADGPPQRLGSGHAASTALEGVVRALDEGPWQHDDLILANDPDGRRKQRVDAAYAVVSRRWEEATSKPEVCGAMLALLDGYTTHELKDRGALASLYHRIVTKLRESSPRSRPLRREDWELVRERPQAGYAPFVIGVQGPEFWISRGPIVLGGEDGEFWISRGPKVYPPPAGSNVGGLSWYAANAFAARLGGSLPTGAQWHSAWGSGQLLPGGQTGSGDPLTARFEIVDSEWCRDRPSSIVFTYSADRLVCGSRDVSFSGSDHSNRLHASRSESAVAFRVVLPATAFPRRDDDFAGKSTADLIGDLKSGDRVKIWLAARQLGLRGPAAGEAAPALRALLAYRGTDDAKIPVAAITNALKSISP